MGKYVMRLDDACERRNVENWDRIESLLDQYDVKPLVGVIPHCEDIEMEKYPEDVEFWEKCHMWLAKGWTIALHGYNHVYSTESGGINPVNRLSEFAGESYEIQRDKISKGLLLMAQHGINPHVFFAPSHTFDENTLRALKDASSIRIISDTIATDAYFANGFTYVPQQSGRVRHLPFKLTTFCYHPNSMNEKSFKDLELFLSENKNHFVSFPLHKVSREKSYLDKFFARLYFCKRLLKGKRT